MLDDMKSQDRDRINGLIAYCARQRRAQISRYRGAKLWNTRRNAREWVLHYGRLIRKMRGAV